MDLFESGINDSNYHVKEDKFKQELDQESFHVERQFNTEAVLRPLDLVSETSPLSEGIEHDMSTVEYGPPREKGE